MATKTAAFLSSLTARTHQLALGVRTVDEVSVDLEPDVLAVRYETLLEERERTFSALNRLGLFASSPATSYYIDNCAPTGIFQRNVKFCQARWCPYCWARNQTTTVLANLQRLQGRLTDGRRLLYVSAKANAEIDGLSELSTQLSSGLIRDYWPDSVTIRTLWPTSSGWRARQTLLAVFWGENSEFDGAHADLSFVERDLPLDDDNVARIAAAATQFPRTLLRADPVRVAQVLQVMKGKHARVSYGLFRPGSQDSTSVD